MYDFTREMAALTPPKHQDAAEAERLLNERDAAEARSMNGDAAAMQVSLSAADGRTDLANCRRLINSHGDNIRYCHPWRTWLVWNGVRWRPDDDGAIVRLAKDVCENVLRDAIGKGATATRFAIRTASQQGIQAFIELAKSDCPISPQELNSDRMLLTCPNGTVDLATGQLREHRRQDFATKLCPTEFIEAATCPTWERVVSEVFDQDLELMEFIQRLFGYSLTGAVSEQVLPVFHGTGANGKSSICNTFLKVIGADFGMQAPTDFLMAKRHEHHPTEMADLCGSRLVISAETEDNRRLAESKIKQLTGGESIRARRMHQDHFEFEPSHKLILCTNHKPRITGQDEGIWRRLRLVPFNVRFDGDRQDKSLGVKLLNECEGILAWAVRGCLSWLKEGLGQPEAVMVATAEYRGGEDQIGRFVAECCQRSERVRLAELFQALEKWCDESGESAPKKRALSRWLREQGFDESKNNGLWFEGLSIIP